MTTNILNMYWAWY